TAVAPAEDDLAVAGRLDRRSARRRVVHAAMCADGVEDRMPAVQVERGADPGKIDGSADEGLTYAQALGGVVIRVAIGVHVAHCAERAAVVVELGGDDVTGGNELAVLVNLLVQD